MNAPNVEVSRSPAVRCAVHCAVIFAAYITVGFLLYRWRVLSQSPARQSDLLVFGVPFLIAWAAFWFALWRSPFFRPRALYVYVAIVAASFAAAFLAFWLYMIFAATIYGM